MLLATKCSHGPTTPIRISPYLLLSRIAVHISVRESARSVLLFTYVHCRFQIVRPMHPRAVYYLQSPQSYFFNSGRSGYVSRYCTSNVPPPGFAVQPYPFTPSTSPPVTSSPTRSTSVTLTPSITASPTVSTTYSSTPVSLTSTPSVTGSYAGAATDPCFTYTPWSDSRKRDTNHAANANCDNTLSPRWYRIMDDNFTFISSSLSTPTPYLCGTGVPAFIPGSSPSSAGAVQSVTAYAYDNFGTSNTVFIKHCGTYLGELCCTYLQAL